MGRDEHTLKPTVLLHAAHKVGRGRGSIGGSTTRDCISIHAGRGRAIGRGYTIANSTVFVNDSVHDALPARGASALLSTVGHGNSGRASCIDHVSRMIAQLKECDSTFVSAQISSLDDASLRQLANALARVLDQV